MISSLSTIDKRVIIAAGAGVIVLFIGLILMMYRRRFKPERFKQRWQDLQKLCASKETWPLAVITADKLLDEVLRKKRCKGKSMGERMVYAQRQLTDNDAVWYAHNLSKKLVANTNAKIRQTDVKKSLVGFRQALRDLGALND